MLTQDVKNQAMDTLDKAQKKKDLFENSNKKLKEFIQKIKDFLTGLLMPVTFQITSLCGTRLMI